MCLFNRKSTIIVDTWLGRFDIYVLAASRSVDLKEGSVGHLSDKPWVQICLDFNEEQTIRYIQCNIRTSTVWCPVLYNIHVVCGYLHTDSHFHSRISFPIITFPIICWTVPMTPLTFISRLLVAVPGQGRLSRCAEYAMQDVSCVLHCASASYVAQWNTIWYVFKNKTNNIPERVWYQMNICIYVGCRYSPLFTLDCFHIIIH